MDAAITDEKTPSRIAAIFDNQADAEKAQTLLIDSGGFAGNKINIIRPHDDSISKKLEPETAGVWHTIIKSHVVLGIIGVVVGLIAAAIAMMVGPEFLSARTGTVYFAFAMIFGMLGLMLAGFVSVRPDRDIVVMKTVEAVQNGKWALVLHTHNHSESEHAEVLLKPVAESISKTL